MARGNAMAVLRKNVAEKEADVITAADAWLPDSPPPGPGADLYHNILALREARKLLRQAEGE